MNICIFEDARTIDCYPLTYTRPVFDLPCGVLTLREKIERNLAGDQIILSCRSYLQPVLRAQYPDKLINTLPNHDTLFINGRVLFDEGSSLAPDGKQAVRYMQGEQLLAAYVPASLIAEVGTSDPDGLLSFESVPFAKEYSVDWKVLRYPWDFVVAMPDEITKDVDRIRWKATLDPNNYPGSIIVKPGNVFVGTDVTIKPGAVLDAEAGTIVIDNGAVIGHNATVIGPCYIGAHSKISYGAKITGECSFGPVSKVGGEVGETIILGYSNKKHDGFLGGSFLGAWVNLGANTNNSDLKNNYSMVRVPIHGQPVDTGLQFSGCIIGDHTKTAIGTTINTGSVFGVGCNIFGVGFPPKFIPSFTWGGNPKVEVYRLEKMLATAEVVQGRRNVEMSEAYRTLLSTVFEMTREQRKQFLGGK